MPLRKVVNASTDALEHMGLRGGILALASNEVAEHAHPTHTTAVGHWAGGRASLPPGARRVIMGG